jgi:hypothetical protein
MGPLRAHKNVPVLTVVATAISKNSDKILTKNRSIRLCNAIDWSMLLRCWFFRQTRGSAERSEALALVREVSSNPN